MANAEFSIESLIAESTGLIEKKPVQQTAILSEEAYDGDEDSLTKEFYKSIEDFDSYCTLERINEMHNAEKIRMLNNLRKVYGSSIEHYGAKLSIESYIDREIRSTEDDKKPNDDGKKENPIIRFFKWIGKVLKNAFEFLKEKLQKFWKWVRDKIQNFRERKGNNVVADVEKIEKAMDDVISKIETDGGSDDSNSSDNGNKNTNYDNMSEKDKKILKQADKNIKRLNRAAKIGEGIGKVSEGVVNGFTKMLDNIDGMIDKALAKIKKAKESNEENAKSNDVNEAEKKLEASKKEVESILTNVAAFMKKPNGFVSKLKGIKQSISEAREKSKAIKSNKMDMKKILKELGTDKIVDIRGAQQGNGGKLPKYIEEATKFANSVKGNIAGFFREGGAPNIPEFKPENDKSDFENYDKFITNILGWKFISMRDVKKSEIVVREVYATKNMQALSNFMNDTINKLRDCNYALEQVTNTVTRLAEQQASNGSKQQVNNDAFTKLKNVMQIHTTIFTKTQMNINRINDETSKIMRALYEVGTPGGENHSRMVTDQTNKNNGENQTNNNNGGNLPAVKNAG